MYCKVPVWPTLVSSLTETSSSSCSVYCVVKSLSLDGSEDWSSRVNIANPAEGEADGEVELDGLADKVEDGERLGDMDGDGEFVAE